MRERQSLGVSFNGLFVDELDRRRGLATRSRYLESVVLRHLKTEDNS